jgi:pilus assembly protein CpaC
LTQLGDHLVVEGQVRSIAQVSQIMELVQTSVTSAIDMSAALPPTVNAVGNAATAPATPAAPAGGATGGGTIKILNLLRVPGSQQVLLKVRVAELNRTAFRQIGGNALGYDSKSGSIFGTQIGNPVTATGGVNPFTLNRSRAFTNASGTNSVSSAIANASTGLIGSASSTLSSSGTLFGIFQNSNFDVFLNALRRNSVLKILAEPNLVALNGQSASFLAGGEFPIPVPQVGATGVASTITVNFKKFGVQLDFLPVILDGDAIRLTVDPVVSSIDFTIGTVLVAGGTQVPGLNTRQAHTTVELRQGQTLAIAGLLQVTLDGETSRVPGLGDLPVLGPFFSNTTSEQIEKELVVLITPYLVEPLNPDQVTSVPGDEVGGPNDLEFYFLNRIEGRTGRDYRATTDGADPLRLARHLKLERKYVRGPVGYSD